MVTVIKIIIGTAFGVPIAVGVAALLFGDIAIKYMDWKEGKYEQP